MFLTNHAALGLIIGQNIANPYAVIFLSLFSHFFLDLIPHGDSKLENQMKLKGLILIALTDLIILSLALFTLWQFKIINIFDRNIILGIFFAMLPDGLQLIYFASNKKLLIRFKQFHQTIHNFFAGKKDFSFLAGLIFQVAIALILYALIIR